jgi:hypothetical protein
MVDGRPKRPLVARAAAAHDPLVNVDEAARRLQEGFVFEPDDALANLRTLTEARAALAAFEPFLVREARRAVATWEAIGAALGVSRQAAHRRHASHVNEVRRAWHVSDTATRVDGVGPRRGV